MKWAEIIQAVRDAVAGELEVSRVPRYARVIDALVIDLGAASAGFERHRAWINSLPLDVVAGVNQEFVDALQDACAKDQALADLFAPLRSSEEMITGAQILAVVLEHVKTTRNQERAACVAACEGVRRQNMGNPVFPSIGAGQGATACIEAIKLRDAR